MKTKIYNRIVYFFGLALILGSCERDLSDEAILASVGSEPYIFQDNFVGMGTDFFFPYSDGFAKAEVLSVDTEVSYEGSASMKIDVPHATNDPGGSYTGAFFRIDGGGRNLTPYNALTFWAKTDRSATIQSIGFGQNDVGSKYQASLSNVNINTTWAKYIIPIPNSSKLINESGMLWLVALDNEDSSYSIWFDEVKFENLGTIAHPQPVILNGEDVTQETFNGIPIEIRETTQTFNLGTGDNITVNAAPSYFTFQSSDPAVASVNSLGIVNPLTEGTSTITATLNGVSAEGSLTVNSLGDFDAAPAPPVRNPQDVISVFSDAYTNIVVDTNYNGFWEPWQTTLGGGITIGNDNIISYSELNFVGIEFFGRPDVQGQGQPIDVSGMENFHIDIRVNETVDASDFLRIELINSVGNNQTSGTYTVSGSQLLSNEWASIDIPISAFNLSGTTAIGIISFVSDATISNVNIDNIYFYKN